MRKKNHFVKGEHTVIGEGTVIGGDITTAASVRVDGIVNGSVISDAVIVVGNTGKVTGQLKGTDVSIAGEVLGNVDVTGKVEIVAKGKLYGDVNTSSINIEDTAIFQGKCNMIAVAKKKDTFEDKDLITPES